VTARTAKRLALGECDQLHHFIAAGVWDATPVETGLLIQADRLVGGDDAVLVIDDTAIPKKGTHSVGVAAQYASALGKTANIFKYLPRFWGWEVVAQVADIIAALTLSLFGILALARAVHGRELSWSPMECQINTNSTPDAIGLSKIVTLVRRTYVESLRHGIYEHEHCIKTISDWVRSQLCTMLAK
jgi:DDE superfamily endonuclease